jgi:cyclase
MYEALTTGGAEAALAATIFHFGEVSITDTKAELEQLGLEMRK